MSLTVNYSRMMPTFTKQGQKPFNPDIIGSWKIWRTAQKPEPSISRSSVTHLRQKEKSYERILTIPIIAVAPIGNT